MESYQTILVVDDEKTNLEFIVANLEQEYKIKTAPQLPVVRMGYNARSFR